MEGELLDGSSARFTWIDVSTVTTARRVCEVWELRAESHIVYIDPVSEPVVGKFVEVSLENTADGDAQCDVHHVVEEAPSVGVAGCIASDESEATRRSHRRWRYSGVEPQQISDGAGRGSRRSDRSRICDQRQQIGAGTRWDLQRSAIKGFNDVDNGRVKKEVGKLLVILRLVHAPAILGTDADHQFVDQRVPHSLYLVIRSKAGCGVGRVADCNPGPGRRAPDSNRRGGRVSRLNFSGLSEHLDGYFEMLTKT